MSYPNCLADTVLAGLRCDLGPARIRSCYRRSHNAMAVTKVKAAFAFPLSSIKSVNVIQCRLCRFFVGLPPAGHAGLLRISRLVMPSNPCTRIRSAVCTAMEINPTGSKGIIPPPPGIYQVSREHSHGSRRTRRGLCRDHWYGFPIPSLHLARGEQWWRKVVLPVLIVVCCNSNARLSRQ